MASVSNNDMFAPSSADEAFDVWGLNGIHSLYDICVDDGFASFGQLTQRFGVCGSLSFGCLQLRQFVGYGSGCFSLYPSGQSLKLFCKFCQLTGNT